MRRAHPETLALQPKIRDVLNYYGYMRVSDIAKILNVKNSTVRNSINTMVDVAENDNCLLFLVKYRKRR